MCKHGWHLPLGWAFLTAQVLMLLGVDVKLVVGPGRLCTHGVYYVHPRDLPGIRDTFRDESLPRRVRQCGTHALGNVLAITKAQA